MRKLFRQMMVSLDGFMEGPNPRIADMDPTSMPFDAKRMVYGGFKVLVDV